MDDLLLSRVLLLLLHTDCRDSILTHWLSWGRSRLVTGVTIIKRPEFFTDCILLLCSV